MRPIPSIRRHIVGVIGVSLVIASCGGGSDSESSDTDDTPPATELAPTSDAAPATDAPDSEAPAATDAPPATEVAPPLEGELVGLFAIENGECAVAGSESGSFFRMVAIGGTAEDGPFVPNGDSQCADQTFIPLLPGTDGGLLTGTYQPGPNPSFDPAGNAAAAQITAPTPFFGLAFGMATTDEAAPPMIIATGGELSGDVAAVSAYYAGEVFNQGSPKPDGSTPGATTSAPTGSIDGATGRYSLEWASQIVGGAFNDFTGVWRLEGVFTPES